MEHDSNAYFSEKILQVFYSREDVHRPPPRLEGPPLARNSLTISVAFNNETLNNVLNLTGAEGDTNSISFGCERVRVTATNEALLSNNTTYC